MRGHQHRWPAADFLSERAQQPGIAAGLHVVVLVLAVKVGGSGVYHYQREWPGGAAIVDQLLPHIRITKQHRAFTPPHGGSGVASSSISSHSLIQRMRTSSGFSPAR